MTDPSVTSTLTDADRAWAKAQVDRAPKLTAAQRDKLADLLRPVRVSSPPTR
ncbi:hypothetical protein ABQF26_04610 [Mycolicibacterium elephantis]